MRELLLAMTVCLVLASCEKRAALPTRNQPIRMIRISDTRIAPISDVFN